MNWATARRLSYFLVFLLIIIASGVFFAFPYFNKPPTCFDGKKNGLEDGVDCGGSCEFVCKESASPLDVLWQRALPSGKNQVVAVALVSNQNKTLGVKNVSYQFNLYDDKGSSIATKAGSSYVPANGNMVFFEGPLSVGNREVSKVTFDFAEEPRFSRVSTSTALLASQVVDSKYSNIDMPRLVATVRNLQKKRYMHIPVFTVLYNKEGNAVLASRTEIDQIDPEGEEKVYFAWPVFTKEVPAQIDVYPIFNQFEIDKNQ